MFFYLSFFVCSRSSSLRITQIWYVQTPPKPGHLEMILMDSKGDKIQVSVIKDEFNQWSQCLLENNTYVMHNFNVLRNDLQYKACDHVYRMQFTPGTTLKQREFPDIPELQYDFKKFSDILSGNFRSDLLIGNYPPTVSNSWCGSKLLIDEEILDIQKYRDIFSTISISCDTMTQCNSQLSQYSNLSDDDRFLYKASVKSINEISSLTSTEEITCVIVGTTTMFVVGRQGWYYDGCGKCTKKADVKDGPFTCKCGHFNQNSTPRYKLDIKEGEDDPKAFPLVLDELLARTMVLRVKVQPSYNQSYVIRLSEDVNLIKKVLDQIGVFESVSMTTDHDPEQFQVVTPAKRLSAEFDLDLLQSPDFNSTQLLSSKMTKHIKTE
ncbi:hypothetical protein Lal_00039521 [Lupinus albus]|nr:hypothetical protein Lal_00039521 [Lupinus albus]